MTHEPLYYGLMQISEMNLKQATKMEDEQMLSGDYANEDAIMEKYKISMEIHPSYAQDLAVYLELNDYPDEDVEKHYIIAINGDDTARPLFNLADFYKKMKDYQNMVQCLQRAVLEYVDAESMIMLALHFAGQKNMETARLYYEMGVGCYKKDQFVLDTCVETIELVHMIDFIQDEEWNQTNVIYKSLKRICATNPSISMYHNKIRLFESLKHVTECGVCFDISLHLDFNCGHCVCKNCFLQLFDKPCPFCRS